MVAFYEVLKQAGISKAEAQRRAQAKLPQDPRFRHPRCRCCGFRPGINVSVRPS